MAAKQTDTAQIVDETAQKRERAEQAFREHDVLALSARDSRMFVESLLNPPAPGAKLRAAAARYKREILMKTNEQMFAD